MGVAETVAEVGGAGAGLESRRDISIALRRSASSLVTYRM